MKNEKIHQLINQFKLTWKKPSITEWDGEILMKLFNTIDEKKSEINVIVSKYSKVTEYCNKFKLSIKPLEGLTELENQVNSVEQTWKIIREFWEDYQQIKSTLWFEFRDTLYKLDDFAKLWKNKTKKLNDQIYQKIDIICNEIECSLPALKYCKGDVPFQKEHWEELYVKLGIEKGLKGNTLLTGHFLDALPKVIENLEFCKDLTGRATGEVNNIVKIYLGPNKRNNVGNIDLVK